MRWLTEIFASAMMVHVPKERANDIYSKFYRLLKPEGLLFVNFKIGDHSLISMDGRFFEYYRDESYPMTQLSNNGLRIEEVIWSINSRTMYDDPKMIRWANFFCRKK